MQVPKTKSWCWANNGSCSDDSPFTDYNQTHFCCQFWLHSQEWHLIYPEEFFIASLELLTFFNSVCLFLVVCSPLQSPPWHKSACKMKVTPDFPVLASSPCLCHEKPVIQVLLYSFFFCRFLAGGCGGFLSCFNGFFVWSGWWYRWFGLRGRVNAHAHTNKWLYASLHHTDAVRFRTKVEHSCFIQTEMKWNSLVAIL